MKICIACGMPMSKIEDFGLNDENSQSCVHCTNEDKKIKSCSEIFNSGVDFFVGVTGKSRELAEKLTRKNMLSLPYWQGNDSECLKGDIATDDEFKEVLKDL